MAGHFSFTVDGRGIQAKQGQTVAEAMLEAGETLCRHTRNGEPRGVYCNMGLCWECRMRIDGVPNVRTCQTLAAPGMTVERQQDQGEGRNQDVAQGGGA